MPEETSKKETVQSLKKELKLKDKEIFRLSKLFIKKNQEMIDSRRRLEKSLRELEDAKTILEIKVKARTKELQELNQGLEEKVKERTKEIEKSKKEIEKKVFELEKWYNLTIGRELKMVELKKRISCLENKLEENNK